MAARKKPGPKRRRREVNTAPASESSQKRNREQRKEYTAQQKAAFLRALAESVGLVSNALKKVGITRGTYNTWYAVDLQFRADVEEVERAQVDYVESRLLLRIREGDTRAMIFYLSNKGKHNGYNTNAAARQTALMLPDSNPAKEVQPLETSSEIIHDRVEMDDDALLEAMKIAQERMPSVFASKPHKIIDV